MRIAVSCVMDVAKSGAWQVMKNILLSLKESDRDNEYVLYAERTYRDEFGELPHNFRLVRTSITAAQPLLNILWHGFVLPFLLIRDNIDVLYLPWHSAALLIKTRPVVFTIHDLTEYRLPGHYSGLRMIYRKCMLPLSSRLVDKIVAVSEYTRSDIVKFLGVQPAKIEVVPNGVSPRRETDTGGSVRLKENYSVARPYILYVGQIQHPNKNLLRLLAAFKKIRPSLPPGFKLVLAGRDHLSAGVVHEAARRLKIKDDVVFTGYVSDDDLPCLYRSAELFVYPSLFEGFGIPPLEAMAYGCPVIASRAGALPEVVGDAGVLVDPADHQALADVMIRVLNDPPQRAEMVRRGLKQAERFSWKDSAMKMRSIFETVGAH